MICTWLLLEDTQLYKIIQHIVNVSIFD